MVAVFRDEPDTARISVVCVESQFLSYFIPDPSKEWCFSDIACKYWLFISSYLSLFFVYWQGEIFYVRVYGILVTGL